MFLGQIASRQALGGASYLSRMVLCQTLLDEVAQGIRGHVIEDFVFSDGSSVQL